MTQEFVTLPREVVECVRGALAYVGVGNAFENPNLAQSTCKQAIWKLDHALRAALEQPQVEQEPVAWMYEQQAVRNERGVGDWYHLFLSYKPASKKFIRNITPLYTHPQNLNCKSTQARLATLWGYVKEQPQGERKPVPNGATHIQPQQGAFYKRVDEKWYVWSRMEDGRPHRWYISPGTVESCLKPISAATEQPQVEQESTCKYSLQVEREPVAWIENVEGGVGYNPYHEAARKLPDGVRFDLYAHPQPKAEPLTHQQIDAIAESMPGGLDGFLKGWGWRQFASAIEAAHNIK